jgi:hypothetical protein
LAHRVYFEPCCLATDVRLPCATRSGDGGRGDCKDPGGGLRGQIIWTSRDVLVDEVRGNPESEQHEATIASLGLAETNVSQFVRDPERRSGTQGSAAWRGRRTRRDGVAQLVGAECRRSRAPATISGREPLREMTGEELDGHAVRVIRARVGGGGVVAVSSDSAVCRTGLHAGSRQVGSGDDVEEILASMDARDASCGWR